MKTTLNFADKSICGRDSLRDEAAKIDVVPGRGRKVLVSVSRRDVCRASLERKPTLPRLAFVAGGYPNE